MMQILSSEKYAHTIHALPDFCNHAYFVHADHTCTLKLFCTKQSLNSRGGTVHVFVPNRHGMGISVRCMMPYDEYRQFTPIQKGAPAAMQRCLITASRRTANANGHRGGRADVWLTVFYFDKVPTVLSS